jgi:hypothetical protein
MNLSLKKLMAGTSLEIFFNSTKPSIRYFGLRRALATENSVGF